MCLRYFWAPKLQTIYHPLTRTWFFLQESELFSTFSSSVTWVSFSKALATFLGEIHQGTCSPFNIDLCSIKCYLMYNYNSVKTRKFPGFRIKQTFSPRAKTTNSLTCIQPGHEPNPKLQNTVTICCFQKVPMYCCVDKLPIW